MLGRGRGGVAGMLLKVRPRVRQVPGQRSIACFRSEVAGLMLSSGRLASAQPRVGALDLCREPPLLKRCCPARRPYGSGGPLASSSVMWEKLLGGNPLGGPSAVSGLRSQIVSRPDRLGTVVDV